MTFRSRGGDRDGLGGLPGELGLAGLGVFFAHLTPCCLSGLVGFGTRPGGTFTGPVSMVERCFTKWEGAGCQ